MLYLVTGKVRKTPYMRDAVWFDAMHLVEAANDSEAESIFAMHYERHSIVGDDTYYVTDIDANPVLTRESVLS